MRREFAKRNYSYKRSSPRNGRRGIVIGVILVLVIGMGFYLHHYKKISIGHSGMSASFSKFKNWVTERKHHINTHVANVKQLVANNNTEQPIHFEFYTALPKMQIKPSDTPPKKEVVAKKTENKPVVVADANEIEQALLEEDNQKN